MLPLDPAEQLRRLLDEVGASRATLRIDVAGMNFPVVAEALVDGVDALSGNNSLDQRSLGTVRYLFEHHDVLVQPDVSAADPSPPAALMDVYGVRAQLLAPLLQAGRVLGWISLHECRGPREWTPEQISAARHTAAVLSEYFGE